MNERVEEIRRRAEQVIRTWLGPRFKTTEFTPMWNELADGIVANEVTALAQAERSVAEFKTTNRLLMGERDKAEADLARVRAALETIKTHAHFTNNGWLYDVARAALEGR